MSKKKLNEKVSALWILVTALFIFTEFIANIAKAECPVEISAETSIFSSYIWRGSEFNEDAVFQPSVTLGYGNMSLNVWGNMDFTDYNDERYSISEIDYTFTWTQPVSFGEFAGGTATYSYPGVKGEQVTTELMVGFIANLPVSPSLTVFQDIDKAEGTYVLLGAESSIPLCEMITGDISGSLGWGSKYHNRYYYEISDIDGSFTDAALNLGLTYGNEKIYVSPQASYILRLNKKMRDEYDTGSFLYGLTVSGVF